LQGTFFRNGPGLLEVNGQRIHHPFDGDGMICAIAIPKVAPISATDSSRTEGYLAEQKAEKSSTEAFRHTEPGGPASQHL
jgi:all-trans-8'-apo-beta-carotenal 15,15'-oxygenase